MQKREDAVFVQVSKDEKKRFFRLARRRRTTLSELIRQALHQECDKAEQATETGKAA
jgi:predicted transcriptional regulator